MGNKVRCVNLDWLEVFAREPQDLQLTATYFVRCGYRVQVREYGTRMYKEMFTIVAPNEEPLLEIRRDPFSVGFGGIFAGNECHIRLTNRSCYFDNAADFLASFLEKHRYFDVRISRVDICLDFVTFDEGDKPDAFIRRYFKHRYAKINQGRISSHGEDTWHGQEWNSLAWGSRTSSVTTKLYNKTMELYDPILARFKKPYIREAWFKCGLIDDISRVTKDGELVNVWRVEFSISSSVKGWVRIELDGVAKKFQSLRNTLDCYNSREKLLVLFASLSQHYFHFKKFEEGKRKDRCEDKILFKWDDAQVVYKIGRNETALGSGQTYKSIYNRLLEKLKAYQQTHYEADVVNACDVLIAAITTDNMRSDLANPWDPEELEAMRKLIKVRTEDRTLTYEAAMSEVKKLLNIKDRTIDKF